MGRFRSIAVIAFSALLLAVPAALAAGPDVTEDAKIVAPDADADSFGFSLAADGNTLAASEYQGPVRVYELRSGRGRLMASITPADGTGLEGVALDGNTLVAVGDGVVYVFSKQRRSWVEQGVLAAADGDSLRRVAISGDTVVATGDSDLHVFRRHAGTWREVERLNSPTGNAYSSIAISGDTIAAVSNGMLEVFTRGGTGWSAYEPIATSDGVGLRGEVAVDAATIVVGALSDDVGGFYDTGSAYVFSFDGSSWSEAQKLTAPMPAEYTYFGRSVDLVGDLAVIGAAGFYSDFDDTAHVFSRSGATWDHAATLVRSDSPGDQWFELDYFGWSVAIADSTIVVGAMWDDDVAINAGAIYLYSRN